MTSIILASSSSARKALLTRLQLPFESISPNIDESALPNEVAAQLALRLSVQKAQVIAEQYPKAWVIGSDQVCTLGAKIYDKPMDLESAAAQLHDFSGKMLIFYTGVCLLNQNSHQIFQSVEWTKVYFKHLSDVKIASYLAADQPIACAGAFKMEQLGITLLSKIESEGPSALIGLPLIRLTQFLEDAKLIGL